MVGHRLDLEVHFLAIFAKELIAIGTLDGGLILLAHFTPDIIRINLGTGIGSRHRTGSEVVDGKILSPPLWNLERTMALWTLDLPAARAYSRFLEIKL